MNIIFLFPDDLTERDNNAFRKQGIGLDDYDYMLLLPTSVKVCKEEGEDEVWDNKKECFVTVKRENIYPEDYTIQSLLRGAYVNTWRYGKYKGKRYLIGIAYHS